MPQETKLKMLQERKAMEESDHELTKELFALPVLLPPIRPQNTGKCMQRNKPEMLQRQRRDTFRVNKMNDNNLKLKELSKKLKEHTKMVAKKEDVFGSCSDEWDNYVYLEDKYA